MERDRIDTFWEVTRKELDETRAEVGFYFSYLYQKTIFFRIQLKKNSIETMNFNQNFMFKFFLGGEFINSCISDSPPLPSSDYRSIQA